MRLRPEQKYSALKAHDEGSSYTIINYTTHLKLYSATSIQEMPFERVALAWEKPGSHMRMTCIARRLIGRKMTRCARM